MYRSLKSKLFDEAYAPVQIGRFRVVQTLGQGGMGVVYSAQDLQLGRLVAIKVIRDDRLREGAKDRARLLREAQMQAKLSHPNVVQIHEVSESEGGLFIVMELVKGATLREWLDREARPLAAILERFVEAARGLSAAHQAGIVHRDFKLANAMVGEDGRVRIADFGLAVADQSQQETEPERTAGAAAAGHTSKHAGTPTYMSPEQVRGRDCDARSDQYSFAVALTEALFRRPPPPAIERLADRTGALALPADPPAPQWLRQALTRALSLDPADRFPSMAALIEVLVETPKRRRRRALAAGLVVALAGSTALGATLFAREQTKSQCSQAENGLASLWDDTRKAALHDAFTATGMPYAEKSWQRASSMLDAYAKDWADVSMSNCQARQSATLPLERHFAQSAACLDRQHDALATLLTDFATADRALVASADKAVAELSPPDQCRVTPTMQLIDGSVGPTKTRVRELLDRGKFLTITHEGRDAVAFLETALAEIRSTADVAGEAEALLLLGRAKSLLSDGPGAKDFLNQAYDRANAAKYSALKWEIWNELAQVHAVVFDDPAEARRCLDHAKSEHHPDPRAAEAAIAAVESGIFIAEKRPLDAVALRRQALATLKSLYSADRPEVSLARLSLAAALGEASQLQESHQMHAQLLADLQKEYGLEHPWPARVELNHGLDLRELQQFSKAREHLEHARGALVRTYGETHLWVAKADVALAQLDIDEDAIPQAIERLERALATYDAIVPPTHAERVNALVVLTEAHMTSGQATKVLDVNRRLLAVHRADSVHSKVDVPGVLANIGDALCTLGQCEEAQSYFAGLLAYDPTSEPLLQALGLRGIGLVQLRQGEPEIALALLQRALKLLEQAATDRTGLAAMQAATMRELAEALAALRRDPRRVRELRRRAAELESAE
ncbi:protein kinase domain-containing protein [Nannocystis pusilla]|uniref:serine/threonine-protein kinase n=1 Tax=Nannocystis pusilla TaxID=889268 RepID=UPI003DA614B8